MRKWINTIIVGIFWIISLVAATGIDVTYHITDRTRICLFIVTLLVLKFERRSINNANVRRSEFIAFAGMVVTFFMSSFVHGKGTQALEYLYAFLVVFLISRLNFTESDFKRIGVCIGVAGSAVLFIYSNMTILRGWNPNSIAMIGFFSYLVFLIPLFNVKSRKAKILVAISSVPVSSFLDYTDSRASILFLGMAILFTLGIFNRSFLYGRNGLKRIVWFSPLAIAIIVLLFSQTQLAQNLNLWSLIRFRKPLFNGRDELWRYGFELLANNPLLGHGDLLKANWHNSAVHVLATYGLFGYCFWICSLNVIVSKSVDFLNDYLIQGCLVGFALIYIQQSVELGIISTIPNLIPYIILGMMLGRVRTLRNNKYVEA